jgi:stage II sporulation protein D
LTARALLLLLATATAHADELSGADKLRVIWSTQFAWTHDGLPLVTVRITEGRDEVLVSGSGGAVRLLPDGEGGAELSAGNTWRVKLDGAGRPAKLRWHVVVARAPAADAEKLQQAAREWRDRGYKPRTIETGTVFGVRGEVIDGRQLLLAVAPHDDEAAARAEAHTLAEKFKISTSLHPEVAERPRGLLVARDERGTVIRNEGVLWLAPEKGGLLAVNPTDNRDKGPATYAGWIYVTVDNKGKLAVVNAVPEDKLLAGLLPAEMGAGAPAEALKAQAVAARNELLAKIGTRHFTDPYRLCASVHCQVYAGAGREDPRTTAAVQATRGELLVRKDGSLVDAVYSASCGGHTEDNDLAWGGTPDPSLRGRLDAGEAEAKALARWAPVTDAGSFLGSLPAKPWCAAARGAAQFRWTARVPAATVEAAAGVGPIKDVRVLERGVSGRAVKLAIDGERGTREVRGELEIRRALGNLKSALFTIALERDAQGHPKELVVTGGGHGHGIGMCQSGAMGMAENGKNYKEILQHYYRESAVRKLY